MKKKASNLLRFNLQQWVSNNKIVVSFISWWLVYDQKDTERKILDEGKKKQVNKLKWEFQSGWPQNHEFN